MAPKLIKEMWSVDPIFNPERQGIWGVRAELPIQRRQTSGSKQVGRDDPENGQPREPPSLARCP